MKTLIGVALASVFLVTAAPATAADTIVATVAEPTTIDAFGGRAVWSAWDPAARAYRLTEYSGGAVRTLPVAPSKRPLDVDLGPGPDGGTVAVYARCRRPPRSPLALTGRRGCDLRAFRFATGRESRLARASSAADEYWPTIWRGRIAFTRTYAAGEQVLYWRSLSGTGRSHRLRTGPRSAGIDTELDLRARDVAFSRHVATGGSLRLTRIGGRGRVLVAFPSDDEAADDLLSAAGPAIAGDTVRWGYVVEGSPPSYMEIRRVAIGTRREQRATTRVDRADEQITPATGFGFSGGVAWYVRPGATDTFEVHMATGLGYEPAPAPELP